ncbi:hypothetical protein EV421DRAFT_1981386 [Armillaria borealis]|uniref:Uncharacterized protein n=1 Tax=Armillaria borealis TaxID=47425 RepID=A0AA39J8Q2_9AGAR|nr:hypothetical protein EV421DRAFT_1981386 [Armillaria borealis]
MSTAPTRLLFVPPSGPQAHLHRWSLVFFTRPGDFVILRASVENGPLIADAVRNTPEKIFEKGQTAKEWFSRRDKYQRVNNRLGTETWKVSRGTESE